MIMNCIPANTFNQTDADREVVCGCGEAFADRNAFREHSLLDHEGQYIAGSSHFLSKFSLVVLPARTQQTKVYQQDAPLQNFSAEEDADVHTKRKTKDRQEFVFESKKERAQTGQSSNRRIGEADLDNLALIRNDNGQHNYPYYCANCRQRDFQTATEFIIHLRDICPGVKKQSSHSITFLDYDKEIQEYMRTNHKPKNRRKNNLKYRAFLKKVFGTNVDHSDLPLLCGPCRQKFVQVPNFLLHARSKHQGEIDSSSSHVILRFRAYEDFTMCLTDRMQWIHDEETALCPCEPSNKMTVARLIKHVRQVHHGISPFYQREFINAVNDQISNHQGGSGHKNSDTDTISAQRTTDKLEFDEQIEDTRPQQDFHPRLSDTINKELINIRLVRNRMTNNNCAFYCGNCRKKDFKDSAQFILHLRDVCRNRNTKSSHFLISRDIRKEIEDYHMNKNQRFFCIKLTRDQDACLKSMGITFDHSDLTFECGICCQIFEEGHSYYLHTIGRHSETIDQNSSHIILRFPSNFKDKRSNIFISDRVQWANDDEICYCPCKPSKKITMANLIKHIRQVHMGISPIYQLAVNDQNSNNQDVSVHNAKNPKKVKVQQRRTEEQQLFENDELIEEEIEQDFHPSCSDAAKDELINLRLVRSPMESGHYIFYCGNCRKHDFMDSTQLIIHLRDVCKNKHPNSSHFLVPIDIRKEIEDYHMKKSHISSTIKEKSRNYARFIKRVLGTTFDHSDLSFECGVCRQIFEEGRSYYLHALARHSETFDQNSSHIILRFPSTNTNKRKHIVISDRVPWINNDERYYCPCKPSKKMTMANLIKHVRQVHMGISPMFEI